MKTILLVLLLICPISYAQLYNKVHFERKDIDVNNKIYKSGRVFEYDYEIIDKGEHLRISFIRGLPENKFELVKAEDDTLNLKIQFLIPQLEKRADRTNKRQTELLYLFKPTYSFMSYTGLVENGSNVWLHPPRSGFFASLETCPYPYVQLPLKVGTEWSDKMKIGNHWTHPLWGEWEGKLLLNYHYKIVSKTTLDTQLGTIDCYVVEGSAQSELGRSNLTSYYSEEFGFVRLEYEMFTGLKVNLWLSDVSENHQLGDLKQIATYIDGQKQKLIKDL